MTNLDRKTVEFERVVTKYEDLSLYRPNLPDGWHYLGPIAASRESLDQTGIIVKEKESRSLADIEDWNPVFIDVEGGKFSTWRGVAPDGYRVVGDFFVEGIDKPTPEQVEGIKAIRNDLVAEIPATRLLWKKVIPFAVLTLWDVAILPRIHIATGAFISSPAETADRGITVLQLDIL